MPINPITLMKKKVMTKTILSYFNIIQFLYFKKTHQGQMEFLGMGISQHGFKRGAVNITNEIQHV